MPYKVAYNVKTVHLAWNVPAHLMLDAIFRKLARRFPWLKLYYWYVYQYMHTCKLGFEDNDTNLIVNEID